MTIRRTGIYASAGHVTEIRTRSARLMKDAPNRSKVEALFRWIDALAVETYGCPPPPPTVDGVVTHYGLLDSGEFACLVEDPSPPKEGGGP